MLSYSDRLVLSIRATNVHVAQVFVLLVLCGATALLGCGPRGGAGAVPPIPDMQSLLQGASLGAGDVIEIRVYEESELSGLYRVSPDGTFDFPWVGVVKVAGTTPSQLAEHLRARLRSGYMRSPQISVFVKEFNSKKVFVLGEVQKPGTFKYEDKMTIVQAVTLAGGMKALAARNRVFLTRVIDGQEQKFVVPFEAIGLGREPNVLLQPGDIILVPESWL